MNLSHKLIKLFASAMLMLGLAASGAAWAACDVSLITVFANGQAVLKADCSPPAPALPPSISMITWLKDGLAIPGVTNLPVIATTQDIYYTTAITTGTSTYTAIGNPLTTPIPAGKAATITSGQTALHVAASAGGTVLSNPAGINCTNAGGALCEAAFPMGTAVTLTTSALTGFSFSNWSGDCIGAGACVVAMTSPRTVVATFGSTPVCTLSANPTSITAGNSSTLTASCPTATSYVWTGGNCSSTSPTCVVTPTVNTGYTVAGVNAGGTGAASSPATTVNVTQAAPVCTPSASPASVTFGTPTNVTLTANCSGSPTYVWAATNGGPLVPSSASQATASFLANTPALTYTYQVTATNGGGTSTASTSVTVSSVPPPACSLTPSPSSFIVGTATNVTLTANCSNATSYAWAATNGGPPPTSNGSTATASFLASATAGTYNYSVIATGPGGTSPAASASVTATPVTVNPGCTVYDATSWMPGNISSSDRMMISNGGEVVSYKLTAAQIITGNPTKQGKIEFSETTPGPHFELSNKACDLTMPLPVAGDASSFVTCASVGGAANRYPDITYLGQDNPNNPAWSAYGYCGIVAPDADGFYYVNVMMPATCGSNCQYFLWYWKQ
jgi:hypothetical protein